MSSLKEAMKNEAVRRTVAVDCCALIEREVDAKGGLTGMAIKTGYKAVKGIKPGFIDKVVYDLLPEFAEALEPIHQEAVAKGQPVDAYFQANAARAADALLAITDRKAERSTNTVAKSGYAKLRGMAKANVESAVPGLAQIITRHA